MREEVQEIQTPRRILRVGQGLLERVVQLFQDRYGLYRSFHGQSSLGTDRYFLTVGPLPLVATVVRADGLPRASNYRAVSGTALLPGLPAHQTQLQVADDCSAPLCSETAQRYLIDDAAHQDADAHAGEGADIISLSRLFLAVRETASRAPLANSLIFVAEL